MLWKYFMGKRLSEVRSGNRVDVGDAYGCVSDHSNIPSDKFNSIVYFCRPDIQTLSFCLFQVKVVIKSVTTSPYLLQRADRSKYH